MTELAVSMCSFWEDGQSELFTSPRVDCGLELPGMYRKQAQNNTDFFLTQVLHSQTCNLDKKRQDFGPAFFCYKQHSGLLFCSFNQHLAGNFMISSMNGIGIKTNGKIGNRKTNSQVTLCFINLLVPQ